MSRTDIQMYDKSYNDIFHLMIMYFSSLLLIIAVQIQQWHVNLFS